MNLFIKIKKIISSVLLLCMLVSIIPVETFAQATSTPNMSAYAGWDSVKSVPDNYTGGDNKEARLSVAREGAQGKEFELTSVEKGGLFAKEGSARGSSPSPFGAGAYNNYTFFGVSTNDGRVSYYARDENGKDFLFAHARDGVVRFPNTKIARGIGVGNTASTDISYESGFINASDVASGKEINTFTTLAGIASKEKLQQKENEVDQDIAAIDKELEEISRGDSDENTEARRIALEQKREELVKAKTDLTRARNLASSASASTKINTDVCPSGFTEIGKFFTSPACIVTMMAIAANTALKLSAFVLYWTGNLFDYSIEIAVNSAEFLNKLAIIEPTWAFVRDMLNMTFIFILLFVAVQILLGKAGYTAKGSIARLVLVAILMNFSLFAAKALVDASNIISLNIYEGIKARDSASPNSRGNVSARIMTTLGLSGIYGFQQIFDGNTVPGCGGVPGTVLTVGIFGTILMLITSLTFLLAAVLFFLRMLNIIVLFITSPVWVWGHVMENNFFQKGSQWWQSNMMHVVKFPIFYMLMLYVSLAMFAQLNTAQVTADGQQISFIKLICDTANTNDATVLTKLPLILNFIIVIAALIGIILFSSKYSGKAGVLGTGKLATDFSNKIYNIQKRFTTDAAQGVYNKSRSAVVGVGSGAVGLVGSAAKGTVTLAKDGIRTKLHERNEKIADTLASRAASGQYTARQSERLAARSEKLRSEKIFGETEKEASERRTKGAKEKAEILAKVQAKTLKVESESEWKEKNPGGDSAAYREYEEKKVKLITQATLAGLEGMTARVNADGSITNTEDFVREGAWDVVKDEHGVTIGTKLNQEKLYKNIQKVREIHSKNGNLLKAEKSKRFGLVTEEKAKVRIKAQEDAVKKALAEVRKKQSGKEKRIKEAREQLDRLPTDFEGISRSDATSKKLSGIIVSYTSDRDAIIRTRDAKLRARLTPTEEAAVNDEASRDIELLKIKTAEKLQTERNKLDDNISKWEKEIESEKEKDK